MKLQKIKYLLLAQDMRRGLAFYAAVFGLTSTMEGDFWSEMAFGDTIIALHGGGDGSPNSTDVSFQVDNIVVACRLIRENGGRILSEPEQRAGEPIVLAVFADTEGNEVMLTQWVG
ncbi:MAG: glyoxalase/bleomycin resistance/dioxygenase family protein [Verrucomicrobiaceae bacterium]|nr:glyoxalase/bleomycin resistance/dioxygenase family protein [Verrucomicrobiaceae bacterium]